MGIATLRSRPRRGHLVEFVALFAAAALAGCSVGATPRASSIGGTSGPAATTPAPSPSPAASTVVTPSGEYIAEADGLTLTVSLDRPVVAPGEVVTFTATLENGAAEPVDYQVPYCGGGASVAVLVDLPQGPSGKTWTGIAQAFKDYVLTDGYGPGVGGPGVGPVPSQVKIDLIAEPCDQVTFEGILAPGASVASSLPWRAEIVAGVGALAGSVPFSVSVGYDRQDVPPSNPGVGVPSLVFPIYKHLVVDGTLEVVGDGPALAGPGEVIDAVLEDEKYSAWLADQPRETWSNANLFLAAGRTDGFPPEGPSWNLDLFLEKDVPRHFALAFIDPFDASLLLAQYCDVPCVE